MSRAQVRSVVTAYLQPPAVSGLNVVLRSQPKDLGGLSYFEGAAPGVSSGAIGVVTIESQAEQPVALDGAGGGRLTEYQVGVQVFHISDEPDARDAMDAFDGVVDALIAHLRSDPRLGLTQAQADAQGLLSGAYQQLQVEFGEPELADADGGAVRTWCVVRFPVQEWNQAT